MKRFLIVLLTYALCLPLGLTAVSAAGENAAPTVLPAIREWQGGNGKFTFSAVSRLVLEKDDTLSPERREIICDYFDELFELEVEVVIGTPSEGDLYLTSSRDTSLGEEGYTMEIGKNILVASPTEQGRLYGAITALQAQYADGFVPCGSARDWPQYAVRSGMIDVARAYVPLEYVEEISKYMAWFKLNEIHLHINDNGENDYRPFRLESDVPGLTSTDGFYTKSDYRAYQKRMLAYGVTVVTEIDTPAHSSCFASVVPELMYDSRHLDISKPETLEFVEKLFDEYITGEDPVFVSRILHIGTDEYPAGHNEAMRVYTDALIRYANQRGYTPRFWGSFGGNGFNGTTEVSGEAQANYWAVDLSSASTLLEMGYDIINTCGPVLYVVPGGNYGFADYYNLRSLYKSWFVNYLGVNASSAIDPDHPQLLGASFALWNDRYTAYGGFSIYDIFDRLRGQVCYIAEKTWCGEQTREIAADDFLARYEKLSLRAGDANPGHHETLPLSEDALEEVKSVGFPYQASFEARLTADAGACTLLESEDGRVFVDSNRRVCLERGGYTFRYDYQMPEEKWTTLRLIGDQTTTTLVTDEACVWTPTNLRNPSLQQSATFVLPVEKRGEEGKSEVRNLLVTTDGYDLRAHQINGNYALGCPVTVSGLEVDYGILNEPLAVDGDPNTRLSFARDKDEQWMVVDLGLKRNVSTVTIDFFEAIPAYEIYVSDDGENYTKVYEGTIEETGVRKTVTCTFEPTQARYVKYLQLKRYYHTAYATYYSGGICEFAVSGFDALPYNAVSEQATALLNAEGADKDALAGVRKALNALTNYLKSDLIYDTHCEALQEALVTAIEAYQNGESSAEAVSEAPDSAAESRSAAEASSAPAENPSEQKATGFPWWGYALCAAGIAAVAGSVVFLLRRKKK